MHARYIVEHPANRVSYATYWRLIKELGIVFVKLGHEQCATCDGYEQHKADGGCGGSLEIHIEMRELSFYNNRYNFHFNPFLNFFSFQV